MFVFRFIRVGFIKKGLYLQIPLFYFIFILDFMFGYIWHKEVELSDNNYETVMIPISPTPKKS